MISGADTVLTFVPHPLEVLAPQREPKRLSDLKTKVERIGRRGVREIVFVPFDPSWAAISAETFIVDVLVGRLGTTEVRIDENFRFGAEARGDAAMLAHQADFKTMCVPRVQLDGQVVCSSAVRSILGTGEVELVCAMLGEPHRVYVRPAHRRSAGLTYRLCDDVALPPPGRYLVRASRSHADAEWALAHRFHDGSIKLRPATCARPDAHDRQRLDFVSSIGAG